MCTIPTAVDIISIDDWIKKSKADRNYPFGSYDDNDYRSVVDRNRQRDSIAFTGMCIGPAPAGALDGSTTYVVGQPLLSLYSMSWRLWLSAALVCVLVILTSTVCVCVCVDGGRLQLFFCV